VIFPLLSLSWIENGGEFREVGWSIPPEMEPVPIIASVPVGEAEPALVRQLSTVGTIPTEAKPPLSGAHQRPVAPPPPG
jgi:hypothetical protein